MLVYEKEEELEDWKLQSTWISKSGLKSVITIYSLDKVNSENAIKWLLCDLLIELPQLRFY